MKAIELGGTSTPVVEAHGARIPALGFGTWELTGRTARRMVEAALELGYRHLDTAQIYGNEDEVGRALDRSGLPREEVFVTTKIWPDSYPPDAFRRAVDERLERLGTSHVDLLLLHWPRFEETSLERTVELLNEARESGKARHVGVSNFTDALVERAWAATGEPLAVNQVEHHPFLENPAGFRAARERDMCITAYCPLANGRVPGDPTLQEIGARHGRGAAPVALRWLIQQEGVAAIPRTSDPDHCRENLEALEVELSDEETRRIGDLAEPGGRVIDPAGLAPEWT